MCSAYAAIGLLAPDLMDPSQAPRLRWRILIVDDDRDVVASLARLLKVEGHEIFVAYDGVEALEAVERHRPELVLLDIGMPGLDGYEVCRRIRASHADPGLRIVAMSGWIEEGDRERAVDAGFDQYLVKPIGYEALVALLIPTRGAR